MSEKIIYPVSTATAARLIGSHPSTLSRIASARGIGRKEGGLRLLTEAEIEQLRGLVANSRGNPKFKIGNYYRDISTKVEKIVPKLPRKESGKNSRK